MLALQRFDLRFTSEYLRKCDSKKMCLQMRSEKWQCLDHPKAGHRSTLRSSVFAFWHCASVYVRLSAFYLRIYATTKVRPVCVYVFENNACVRK